jgi:hypothetical protein
MQRRRGQLAIVYRSAVTEDARGNEVIALDRDNPITVRAAFIPQRSARAEVPGQQQINVTRMIVDADLPDVTLWSEVEAMGKQWDIVTPPAYHHGSRKTRHWSIDIRERPS